MKTNRSFLPLLITLILLLGACRPQATPDSDTPPAESTSAPEAVASSPAETDVPAAAEAPQVQNSSLFAKLSELAGKVELKQAGQSSFAPASADVQIGVNGQIQTGEDGRVRLDLSSGTIIRIAPSSLFTLTVNEETEGGLLTKIKMELGKIFIILNGGSAEVETPSGVAAVQGSYLKVEFDPETGELTLTCLEGNCSATTPDGKTIDFTDGQKIVIHQDADGNWVMDEGPMSPEDFQEWLDNNPEAITLVEQATGGGSDGGGEGGSCFGITEPGAGAGLPHQGKVKFAWESQPGAAKYVIKFTNVNGKVILFETSDTNIEQYVEGFLPQAGEVSWSVTALNETGEEICSTEPTTFTKPDSNYIPEPKNEPDEEPSGSTCTYCYY